MLVTNESAVLNEPMLLDRWTARFVAHGLAEDRVRYVGSTPRTEHLAMLSQVDMALDPFPQNGGISTWEALQMGVPVVTKLGTGTPAARAGASIVKAVGLEDWVATAQPARLAELRACLPAMVANSEAGNSKRYTHHVEEAYRKFWRDYCAANGR